MPSHEITIDEQTGREYAAKAFCVCGWAADAWRHDDQAPSWPSSWDAACEAYDAAKLDGLGHLRGEDAAEPLRLLPPVPALDRLGNAVTPGRAPAPW
jgi:hypothetical protein